MNVNKLLQKQHFLYTQHPLRHFLSTQMQPISQLDQYYIKLSKSSSNQPVESVLHQVVKGQFQPMRFLSVK